MTLLFNHKKGTILGVFFLILILVIIGVIIPIFYMVGDILQPSLDKEFSDPQYNLSRDIVTTSRGTSSLWDSGFLFIFIGFWLTVLITSFFLDTHPVFFLVSVIILIVMLFGLIGVNNMYIKLASLPDLLFIESTFPMMYWICSHSFIIAIFISSTVLLALYGRSLTQ